MSSSQNTTRRGYSKKKWSKGNAKGSYQSKSVSTGARPAKSYKRGFKPSKPTFEESDQSMEKMRSYIREHKDTHLQNENGTVSQNAEWLNMIVMGDNELSFFFKWHLISIIDPLMSGTFTITNSQLDYLVTKDTNYPEELDILFSAKVKNKAARLAKLFRFGKPGEDANQKTYSLRLSFDDGVKTLCPVQSNYHCRASRKYGAFSFLSVNTEPSNIQPSIDLCSPYDLGNWVFLYYKFERSKAFYVRTVPAWKGEYPCLRPEFIRDWFVSRSINCNISIAKYNARMSLAFSSTVCIENPIDPNDYEIVLDINHSSTRLDKCDMTDGCGLISASLLAEIARECNLPQVPSAIQGRFGACKGVWVAANNDIMNGKRLICRKSQEKFKYNGPIDVSHRKLEIVGYSKAQKVNLYRGALLFLTTLGLSMDTIHDLCQESATLFEEKIMSVESLLTETKDATKDVPKRIHALLRAGFGLDHPFIYDEVCKMREKFYEKTLKTKAKIPVEKSAFLLMVPDITGTLEPNEVYVHFSDPIRFGSIILESKVVVFRSPLQLLSDIQIMTATNCPALSHIKDCIVFSTKGTVPPASLLSGGDYDGDKAWVIWDPRFLQIRPVKMQPEPNLTHLYGPHPAGTKKLDEVMQIQEALLEYCQNQNSHTLLGYYSTRLAEEVEQEYLRLLKCPSMSTIRMKENPTILKLGYCCTIAVDASKADLGTIDDLWFGRFNIPECTLTKPPRIYDDANLITEDYGRFESLALNSIKQLESVLCQEDKTQKLFSLRSEIKQICKHVKDRLAFASACYINLKPQEWGPCHELLWDIFLEEFCRLKADEISEVSVSVLHEHLPSL